MAASAGFAFMEVLPVDIFSVAMKSVPPRGSGWVGSLPIANCRFQLFFARLPIGIWQPAIGNALTHPLPRGGTDFIALESPTDGALLKRIEFAASY